MISLLLSSDKFVNNVIDFHFKRLASGTLGDPLRLAAPPRVDTPGAHG
jgi:hypothetical protein